MGPKWVEGGPPPRLPSVWEDTSGPRAVMTSHCGKWKSVVYLSRIVQLWPLVNCPREMPFLGLLFTLLIPLDSQIHFVFRAKRKIWKIMCTKNKIKYLTVLPLKIILWRSQAYFVFYLFFFHMSQKIFLGLPWRSSDGRLCFQSRWPRFDPWSGN